MKIVIDTDIWALGLKGPFMTKHDPDAETALTAQSFLKKQLQEVDDLLFSDHLLFEIYDVLTRRGNQIPAGQAKRLIEDLIARSESVYRPVSSASLLRCVQLSSASGIPLSDYLVCYPFEDAIDRVYTMDAHFRHSSFQSLAQIENPIGVWKNE